jgi:hypothetical protein
MAKVHAIAALCESIMQNLRSRYVPAEWGGHEAVFKVFGPDDFASPPAVGISLFPFRVAPNSLSRSVPGRTASGGSQNGQQLVIDLYFFLTVWARDPLLQNGLLGWALRCMDDVPVLTSSVLNAALGDVFRSDETVEVVLVQMDEEEFSELWRTLGDLKFRLSVPYLARGIQLESGTSSGGPVVGAKSEP